MATFTRFEDIEVWQLARELNKVIGPVLIKLQDQKNYQLYKQMDRSAGSIMDNIAEGFEREGTREFIQFLAISKGSAAETRSQLYRALDRGQITEDNFKELNDRCLAIGNKLGRFMNYLASCDIKGRKFKNTFSKQ